MRLPRIYVEERGGFSYYRGVRTTGDGPPFALGERSVVSFDDAQRSYLRRLRILASKRRKVRLGAPMSADAKEGRF